MNILYKAIRKPGKACSELIYQFQKAMGNEDYQPFLILTRSRTGSTLLSYSLDDHPEVRCRAEVFNRLLGRDPGKLFDSIYGKQPKHIKAAGFKIFYYHPNDTDGTEIWNHLVSMNKLKVIHLRRESILRTLVSRKIAGLRNEYQYQKNSKQETKQIEFTIDELSEGFETTSAMEQEGAARFSDHTVLDITYEQMVADPAATFASVQEFLGVSPRSLNTTLRKQNPEPISALITNFGELSEHFAGSKWGKYFAE